MISATSKAILKIKEFTQQGKVMRLKINSGGCNGFEYQILLGDAQADDIVYSCEDVVIHTDKISNSLLPKLEIDYEETLGFTGFKFNNPNATSKCGCGRSFS
ncbi:iron-sulfur cluster assembly accessory protein [Candidatus Parcubacteria bacterium]|nr:MAG: iron-sulfur cluster assembly accessory protein [Candidatus Parcubacteria bacterium]